jgi:large subunit ribosomal protein L32
VAPLPKKKTSLARRRGRRAHLRASVANLVACPQCRSPKPAYRACPICGTYRGRDILTFGREFRKPAQIED